MLYYIRYKEIEKYLFNIININYNINEEYMNPTKGQEGAYKMLG